MAKFQGKALLPWPFIRRNVIPSLFLDTSARQQVPHQIRKHLLAHYPGRNQRVGQISLRVNEVCNLRCGSCGQWGENGHLRQKLELGERLSQPEDFNYFCSLVIRPAIQKIFK